MIRLIKAELLRLSSRRITLVAAILAFVAVAGMGTLLAFTAKPPSQAQLEAGQQAYQQAVKDAQQYAEECKKDPPADGGCDDFTPKPEWYVPQPSSFSDVAGLMALAGTAFVTFAAIVIAASLVGADFSGGGLSTWLSFEPRRGRVFASRAIVTVIAMAVVASVILTLGLLGLGIAVRAMQGADSITHAGNAAIVALRGVGVVGMAALGALALAFLTRRTIAVVGIAFGYLVVRFVASIFQMTRFYGLMQPWLPETNVLAVMHGKTDYTIYTQTVTSDGFSYNAEQHVIGWEHGLLYLGVGLVILVVLAVVSFRRRDVG